MRSYEADTDHGGHLLVAWFRDPPTSLVCADCGRPAYYDDADEGYHHAVDAPRGCFLVSAEDRADDAAHPLHPRHDVDTRLVDRRQTARRRDDLLLTMTAATLADAALAWADDVDLVLTGDFAAALTAYRQAKERTGHAVRN